MDFNKYREKAKQIEDDFIQSGRTYKDVLDKVVIDLFDEMEEELIKLHQPTVIGCMHPFNEVVSGDDGDFCCQCQTYLKSNRL